LEIYVIDIARSREPLKSPEDEMTADLLYLHRDKLRGCTEKRINMKFYYDYLVELTKGLVEVNVFRYEMEFEDESIFYDETGNVYQDTIQFLARDFYNKGTIQGLPDRNYQPEPWDRVASMPYITSQSMSNGGNYFITSAMMDIFTERYMSDAEDAFLLSLAGFHSPMNMYVYALMNDRTLIALRERLLDLFMILIRDLYGNKEISVDPVVLTKIWVEKYGFFD
jgi:hypothetical protein